MVTKTPDAEELSRLARSYLDLWVEHWGACLASPETAAALTQLMSPQAWAPFAAQFMPQPAARDAGPDDAGGQAGANPVSQGHEPAPLPAAHAADDERTRKLEERIAALERRLAEFGDAAGIKVTGKPRTARKPAGATRTA